MSKSAAILICLFTLSCVLGAISKSSHKPLSSETSFVTAQEESSKPLNNKLSLNFTPQFNVAWNGNPGSAFNNIYSKTILFIISNGS
ncbi:MAG: hypothetical protein SFU25_02470 [Candidatus Caenarcaniphilales bacterium]|nr:hypothetical protein [Candidatus Caenarcaniphilales bacterium]